jgi:hypothetical protein
MTALTIAINLVDRVWTTLCRPLIMLLNVVFRPDPTDGSIGKWKLLAWFLVNCGGLILALRVADPRVRSGLIGLFVLVHILVILGSLRVMSEEKKVLEGSLAPDQMTFSVYDAVNSIPVLSVSIVFYILGLPALIGVIEEAGIAQILSRRPAIGFPYAANLACVLNEMPAVGPILHASANLTGLSPNLNADIVYTGLAGNFVRLVIVGTVGFVIVRAIVLRLQQASHREAILNSVEQRHGHWDLVHSRLLRLPHKLADRLRRLGASETDGSMRQRIEPILSRLGHPHNRAPQ